jgi:hypothetical protein
VTSLKEACRERWLLPSVELWLQDARFAERVARAPGRQATICGINSPYTSVSRMFRPLKR